MRPTFCPGSARRSRSRTRERRRKRVLTAQLVGAAGRKGTVLKQQVLCEGVDARHLSNAVDTTVAALELHGYCKCYVNRYASSLARLLLSPRGDVR